MKRKIVFICCPSRSGSTIVDLMLGNDPNIFSTGEVYCLFYTYKKHHAKFLQDQKKHNSFWSRIDANDVENIHFQIMNESQCPVIIDSSKELGWFFQVYNNCIKNNIDVEVILVFKPFIRLYHSFKKRGLSDDKIQKQVQYYKEFLKLQIPYIPANLSDLTNGTEDALRRLCQLLEVPFFEGKQNFWVKNHLHLFGSQTTRSFLDSDDPKILSHELTNDEMDKNHALMKSFKVDQIYTHLHGQNLKRTNESCRGKLIPINLYLFKRRNALRIKKFMAEKMGIFLYK